MSRKSMAAFKLFVISPIIKIADIFSYPGEENVLLPVSISTTDDISGIQFILEDIPDWATATSSESLIESFEFSINIDSRKGPHGGRIFNSLFEYISILLLIDSRAS